MKILEWSRQEIESFVEKGAFKKKEIKHWDICKKIAEGITQEKISDIFNLTSRQIRKIKCAKCPDIGILPGYRKIGTP